VRLCSVRTAHSRRGQQLPAEVSCRGQERGELEAAASVC
jgi:hypothetical protein